MTVRHDWFAASHTENICASVKRDVAELCHSSGTLQALVEQQRLAAGRPAELMPSAQVRCAADRAGFVVTAHALILDRPLCQFPPKPLCSCPRAYIPFFTYI